ncbi:MAG: hypothetical protein HYV34_03690 [Candidatus Kerfeldbacteria bacterium]|nr:hypothetical protein [Candidatus Kerfeldbacteria bacterium]
MLELTEDTLPPRLHIGRSRVYVIFAVPSVAKGGRAAVVEHCSNRPRGGRGFICNACFGNRPTGMELVGSTRLRQLAGDPKLNNSFDTHEAAVAAALSAQLRLDQGVVG